MKELVAVCCKHWTQCSLHCRAQVHTYLAMELLAAAAAGPAYKFQMLDKLSIVLTDPNTIGRITRKTGTGVLLCTLSALPCSHRRSVAHTCETILPQ